LGSDKGAKDGGISRQRNIYAGPRRYSSWKMNRSAEHGGLRGMAVATIYFAQLS
jgi:hypothetical protein